MTTFGRGRMRRTRLFGMRWRNVIYDHVTIFSFADEHEWFEFVFLFLYDDHDEVICDGTGYSLSNT